MLLNDDSLATSYIACSTLQHWNEQSVIYLE